MPSGGNTTIIGTGIQPGGTFVLQHLLYVTNVQPPQASTFVGQHVIDGNVDVLAVADSAGNLPVSAGATETFRVRGGIISEGSGGTGTTQLGKGASAAATDSTVIGRGASASAGATDAIVIGRSASATFFATQSVVIGAAATDGGQQGVVIGGSASFTNAAGVVIGQAAGLSGAGGGATGIAIGQGASAANVAGGGGDSLAIGTAAVAKGGDTVIGANASSNTQNALGAGNVVIGSSAVANVAQGNSIVIGNAASGSQQSVVVIGQGAVASAASVVIIGRGASASTAGSIAIGSGATISHVASIVIGATQGSIGTNTAVIGGSALDIRTVVIGAGDTISTPSSRTMRYTNATGVDNAAGDVIHVAPQSTGAAVGARHVFRVGQPGVSSGTLQTLVTPLILDATSTLIRANFGTSVIQLGAAPGSTGAVNVDSSSYTNGASVVVVNGTSNFQIRTPASGTSQVGDFGSNDVFLTAQGTNSLRVGAGPGAISTLTFVQATARIVGGATNGVSLRNSANTRDNLAIADNGAALQQSDGTTTITQFTTSAMSAGGDYTTLARFGLMTSSGTMPYFLSAESNSRPTGLGYRNTADGTFFSAAEVIGVNVAAAKSILDLMKAGGIVRIGTAPGNTANALTIDGTAFGAGVASLRFNGLTNGAGASAGTLTNAPSVGNPNFWIPVNIAGTVRFVPAW